MPGEPSLAERVSRVPTDPGCYLWKDSKGEVVYVGKAKNLRARMRQYVTLQDDREKIPLMMQVVRDFDYVVVGSEHEALVLERNLIAQYHPYFNVDYKDDKSYAREASQGHALLWPLHRRPRRSRDDRHAAQGRAHLPGDLRRVEACQAHPGPRPLPGSRGEHGARPALPTLL